MKIADIMTKDVLTIGPDSSLRECAYVMKNRHVNGLVVLDGKKVVGVITKADIFKAILPTYTDIIEDEHHIASFEYIEERAHKLHDLKAKSIIGTPAITVESNMPVVKAGSIMILKRVKQLPVVDSGELKGIVTFTDIINYILEKTK